MSHKEHNYFSPCFKITLHINTDEEIEGASSSVVEYLLNLKGDTYPYFNKPNSPLQNFTRSSKSKMVSPSQCSKLELENARLKGELQEYHVLDRFIKNENTTLKGQLAES